MCFVHFHFKMCFSPQRRAIFQHLNFKKWSGADVFCTFSLQNVLLATATPEFFSIFTSKCASRHSGVQFLISPLTTWLRTRRFNEPTFDSPDTRIIGKTQRFATSLTFGAHASSFFWLSRYCIFFLLTLLHLLTLLSSDFTSSICFSSAFQLSILSEVYYLNFLRQCTGSYQLLHGLTHPAHPKGSIVQSIIVWSSIATSESLFTIWCVACIAGPCSVHMPYMRLLPMIPTNPTMLPPALKAHSGNYTGTTSW